MTSMDGYIKRAVTAPLAGGRLATFDVYERGEGPPVVIMQELPGIGQEALAFAERLVTAGYRVVLAHWFGPLGETSLLGNAVRLFCMRREFSLFAANKTSPVVEWVRALCRDVKARTGASGVGVVGMCLSGNFAISLMADDAVLAAVASQPSMPVFNQGALHMSEADVASVREALDTKGPAHAYRIEGDAICTARKFEALDTAFNDDRERLKLKTLPGNGHSVFTIDFVDEAGHPTRQALDEVLAYFGEKLRPSAPM